MRVRSIDVSRVECPPRMSVRRFQDVTSQAAELSIRSQPGRHWTFWGISSIEVSKYQPERIASALAGDGGQTGYRASRTH